MTPVMGRPKSTFETARLAAGNSVPSRAARTIVLVLCIILVVCHFNGYTRFHTQSAAQLNAQASLDLEERSMANASNSTLGFHKIMFMNLQKRYDRTDAATLMAYLSGVDLEEHPGVEKEMISDIGMPPTHRPAVLTPAEFGCWRAHANVWSEMLRKKLPPVLILESDAAWDVNIRPIMSILNKHFVSFLQSINSTALPNPRWDPSHDGVMKSTNTTTNPPSQARVEYDPSDPWLSSHWDLLSLGHCFEHSTPRGREHETQAIYGDPHVPAGKNWFGYKLGSERVIRKSGGITCATAYAVSQTGAAKLLLRSAVDLDNPVDLLIRRLTMSGDLLAYSVHPTLFAQWKYVADIGMDQRGAQSDIRGRQGQRLDKNARMTGWDNVKNTRSVWEPKRHHPDWAFENMGLQVAWERILGKARLEDSWYNERTKN